MAGACPDTRANNYAVSSLNIVNKCGDGITATDAATCNDVINKGAPGLRNTAACSPTKSLVLQQRACTPACRGSGSLRLGRRYRLKCDVLSA